MSKAKATTAKTPAAAASKNWDEPAEQKLRDLYAEKGQPSDTDTLTEIGKLLGGKTAAAVRGKLVSLGIYQKGEPKAVGGASSTRKSQIVTGIEVLASMPKGSLESLEKASKPQLEALAAALSQRVNTAHADAGIVEPSASE